MSRGYGILNKRRPQGCVTGGRANLRGGRRAAGGGLEQPLQLVWEDDKSNPSEGTKIFRELASKKVLVILGNSGPTTFASPISLAELEASDKLRRTYLPV